MLAGFTRAVPLALQTTFKTGGAAEYFARADSETELIELVAAAQAAELPLTILGGGSNVLVADSGVPGCVIQIALRGVQPTVQEDAVLLSAAAGEVFDEVVAYTVEQGWCGLENLSHIPGSVGATPIQNVGAYGVEVADCIHTVRILDTTTSEVSEYGAAECQFAYRDSRFKREPGRFIVLAVTFKLSKQPNPKLTYKDLASRFPEGMAALSAVRAAIIAIRAEKFPDWHQVGTAGSFFKNPIIPNEQAAQIQKAYPDLPTYPVSDTHTKIALGWVLEHVCHMRGVSDGAVGTYAGQALVVVQTGGATTSNITDFVEQIAATVKRKTSIDIEWEVTKVPYTTQ